MKMWSNRHAVVFMPDTTSFYPSFKLDQLDTLSVWGAMRPVGLGIKVVTNHDYRPEVAMLYQPGCYDPQYIIYPKVRWRVVLVQLRGDKWELPTLERALSKVISLEPRTADFSEHTSMLAFDAGMDFLLDTKRPLDDSLKRRGTSSVLRPSRVR